MRRAAGHRSTDQCNRVATGTTLGWAVACALLLALTGSAGDSAGQTAPVTPPAPMAAAPDAETAPLRERAAAFWAARVSGDVQAQWDLLEPRWRGRMTPFEYGAELTGGRYLAYQVEGATLRGSFAEVKVKLLVQQALPPSAAARAVGPQAVVLDDGWVRIRGVWYRRLDDIKVPSRTQQVEPSTN